MQRFIFPGSFDPPTKGHLDIIERAVKLCDELVLAILINPAKKYLFTLEERLSFLNCLAKAVSSDNKIKVVSYEGLLVNLVAELEADAVVRGIRNTSDYQYEADMAIINHKLRNQHESIFLPAKPELQHVSSTAVRTLIALHADYDFLVPEICQVEIKNALDRKQ